MVAIRPMSAMSFVDPGPCLAVEKVLGSFVTAQSEWLGRLIPIPKEVNYSLGIEV